MDRTLEQILKQLMRFSVVGVIGFAVDAGVLTLLLHTTRAGHYIGRVGSFLCAATVTWVLNRTYTFDHASHHGPARQWVGFLGANALGGLVNFGVYSALISSQPAFARAPVLAVAAGSLAGLGVNFSLSRAYVFAAHPNVRR